MNKAYGMSVWRTIRNLCNQLAINIIYKVGNEARILFWEELWTGQETLMASFPDLFILSTNADAKINEMWSPQGWNLSFRRLLND